MPPRPPIPAFLAEPVRAALAVRAGRRPVCLVCGRPIGERDRSMRLHGEMHVHQECATYRMRRRRVGVERLGSPRY